MTHADIIALARSWIDDIGPNDVTDTAMSMVKTSDCNTLACHLIALDDLVRAAVEWADDCDRVKRENDEINRRLKAGEMVAIWSTPNPYDTPTTRLRTAIDKLRGGEG